MRESRIYSIGHGNKSIETFIEELLFFKIDYLIDVRSIPYSKSEFIQQFNQDVLSKSLSNKGIKYIFMGKELGGLPKDDLCYTSGRVDYSKLKENIFFKDGLKRLVVANDKQLKIAIMCSESNPAECHRTKLIGEELTKKNINLNHIIKNKEILSQKEVMSIVFPNGKNDLFGKIPLTSRRNIAKGIKVVV